MSFDLCIMTVLGTLIMCGVMMPPFVAVLIPVLTIYVTIMIRYGVRWGLVLNVCALVLVFGCWGSSCGSLPERWNNSYT